MRNGVVRVLVVGVGNMGLSHALAYQKIDGFEVVGLCSRTIRGRNDLPAELAALPRYESFDDALSRSSPDVVSVNTYPDTHEEFCIKAFGDGCHVFTEKPLATTVEGAPGPSSTRRARPARSWSSATFCASIPPGRRSSAAPGSSASRWSCA